MDKTLKNILHVLQSKPENYKLFGVYWWFVKRQLKKEYTSDHLYLLGGYIIPGEFEHVTLSESDEENMQMALGEYVFNQRFAVRPTDEHGQPYEVNDRDALS